MKNIAFLGMGLMGSRMAKRLLDAGYHVAVWNRTASACQPLLQQGAKALNLTQIMDYPFIFTCLADDYAVSQVIDRIYPDLTSGQIVVDFSSVSVEKTREMSEKMKQKQCAWIDCPVSGGVQGAEAGTLVMFAGGEEKYLFDLKDILSVLSQRVTYMGGTGAGQATKICNQLIVASTSTIIAEAVQLAKQAGVDATLLAPALADGFADSKPLQILAPRMATYTFEPVQWKVQTLRKDLNNAVTLAKQYDLHIPVAKRALQQLENHQNQGFAEKDLATIICQLVEK